jgi:acyl-coenzyme A synthetase/AMP-(fatty) acid ligase
VRVTSSPSPTFFKVPRSVRVADALPLNATGKVLKYELRALATR